MDSDQVAHIISEISSHDEEEYNTSEDEDFNPELAAKADAELSSSEDEAIAGGKASKRQRKGEAELDSGDEAMIQQLDKAKRRKRKGKAPDEDEGIIVFSDDEGGEGGLIKTRAQRQQEVKERRPLADTKGATVDVDAIWARLSNAPVTRDLETEKEALQPQEEQNFQGNERTIETAKPVRLPDEEYVTIKRTYRFAGKIQTEERRVPKQSAEGRLYLAEQEKEAASKSTTSKDVAEEAVESAVPQEKPIRRPLKRPSRFDPNPLGEVRGLAPEHQLRWPRTAHGGALQPAAANALTAAATSAANRLRPGNKPQKLNTVDKSRYDWVQYVDKEGISEELDEYGRAKESYLGRMDFLGRTEEKREGERRRIRLGAAAGGSAGV